MKSHALLAATIFTLFSASAAFAVEGREYALKLKQLVGPDQCIYSVDVLPQWFGKDEWRTVIADARGNVVDIITQQVSVDAPVYNLPVYVAANARVPLCNQEPLTSSKAEDFLMPLDD